MVGTVLYPWPAPQTAPSAIITVIASPALSPQQILTLHFTLEANLSVTICFHMNNPSDHLETRDISIAKVLAELLDLLELEQVYPEHLDGDEHEVIHLLVPGEEGLLVPLLVLGEGLDIDVEGVCVGAVWTLGRQLTLLKEKSQQRIKRVSVINIMVISSSSQYNILCLYL